MALDAKKLLAPGGILVGAIVIVILGIIISSVKKLNSTELGLKYDNIAKKLSTQIDIEGLHLGPPGFSFIIFPSVFQTMEFQQINCLNKDGVIIDLDVSYQFKANAKYMRTLVEQFKDFDGYKKVLLSSGKSAVHDSCANFTTTEFQTDRGRYQEKLREIMRDYCNSLHCLLNDLQVNNLQRPEEFENAVKEKEAAKENIRVALNQRPRLIIQAETELDKAKKQAEIILNNANTEAKITKIKADNEAKALEYEYEKDMNVYKQVKDSQNLDNDALISYMTIRAISNSKNDINMALKSPGKTSYSSITD